MKYKRTLLPFILGSFLGAAVFLLIFGTSVVSPSNTSWLFTVPDDSAQHHLGWVFYRKTKWTFPLCLTEGLSSDGMVSCMYSDSIPIMALIFKLISPVLPDTFQYLGIWGVLCFALNGGFGAVLLNRVTRNIPFSVIGSLFYSAFIPSIARITHHNSLGAIWLIIIPLILCIDRKQAHSRLKWSIICIMAVMTHVYFVPMIFLVMSGYVILLLFRDKKAKQACLTVISSTASVLITMWCIGAFYGNGSYTDGGFGMFSANLNTFYNSMGYSRFLPELNTFEGQGEGFGYLGLGMLICISAAFVSAGINYKKVVSAIKIRIPETAAFCTVFITSFFWAVSSRITLNDYILADIPIPHFILSCLSVFRASGRFIWLPCILLITAALGVLSKTWKKYAIYAIILGIAVQITDISRWCMDTHRFYSQTSDNYTLNDQKWDELTENASEIIFLPLQEDHLNFMQLYFDFARLADIHDMKLSSFYLARSDIYSIASYANEQYTMLCTGRGRPDVLYVFFHSDDAPTADNVNVYEVDGYTVARVK